MSHHDCEVSTRPGTRQTYVRERRASNAVGDGDWQGSSEVCQLVGEIAVGVEVQAPPFARESPVANINDPPIGRRLEVDDEIDAFAIGAVHQATRSAARRYMFGA